MGEHRVPTVPEQTPRTGRVFGRALVGSAKKIDVTSRQDETVERRRGQPWQTRAWNYYDEIGEVWFAHNFVGNALRKAKLTIAAPSDDPNAEPEPVQATDSDLAGQAYAELNRIQADTGGQGEVLASAGLNLGVAGEGYVVGWTPEPDDGEQWDFVSVDQIKIEGGRWILFDEPGQQSGGYKITENDFLARIWRRHPRWRGRADSSMRAVLGACDELLILSRAMRATAVSRSAGNGLLLVPEEISFGNQDPTMSESDGQSDDPFNVDLIDAMMTPIQEPDNASAVVPLVVRGPSEMLHPDVFRHLTLDRPLDEHAAQQRDELIRRIANGLDLPADILLGLGSSNHWSAWLIDDQTFRAHIEPLLVLICWGLTSSFLRPALRAAGFTDADKVVVWYDATAIVARPNQAQDAKDVHKENALSDEALRRYTGFTEDDAPTPEETAARRAASQPRIIGAPGQGPVETPAGQDNVDETPPVEPVAASVAAGLIGELAPIPAPLPLGLVAATAGRPRDDRLPLGGELVDLERALRARLQATLDAALFRSLERAGARLRRKVGSREPLAAVVKDVSNDAIAARLGASLVRQLGFSDDAELLDTSFAEVRPKWEAWTTSAQRRVAQIATRYNSDLEPNDYVQQNAENRAAGWEILSAGLAALATQRLYDPSPVPSPIGELDDSSVPPGIVRGALSRAGGAIGTIGEDGRLRTVDATGADVPAGGLATGVDTLALFADLGVEARGYVWTVGAPSRPFEPHQDLEGEEFSTWTDDVLTADAGEFPGVDFYAPGDHDGCQCDAMPLFDESGALPSSTEGD